MGLEAMTPAPSLVDRPRVSRRRRPRQQSVDAKPCSAVAGAGAPNGIPREGRQGGEAGPRRLVGQRWKPRAKALAGPWRGRALAWGLLALTMMGLVLPTSSQARILEEGGICEIFAGGFETELTEARTRLRVLEEIMVRNERDDVQEELEVWLTVEQRLSRVAREWTKGLEALRGQQWTKALKSVQQALGILMQRSPLARAIIQWPKRTTLTCLKGVLLQHLGDHDRALDAFEQVFSERTIHSMPWERSSVDLSIALQLARLHLRKGQNDLAETFFREALSLDRNCVEAHRGLGLCYDARYLGAVETKPSLVHSSVFRRNPARRNTPAMLADRTQLGTLSQQVLQHFTRALNLGCTDAHVLVRVAVLLAEREEWDAAARYLTKAAERWPDSAQVHFELGRVLRSRGQVLAEFGDKEADALLRQAVGHLQQALWLDKSDLASHVELADLLLFMRRSAEALETALEADRRSAGSPATQMLLARVSAARNDTKRTIGHLQNVLRHHDGAPERLEALILLAETHATQGRLEDASSAFARVVKALTAADPLHQDLVADMLVRQADMDRLRGDVEAAVKGYERALFRDANHPQGHAGLAYCALADKRLDEAWSRFQLAIDNGVTNVDVLLDAAELLLHETAVKVSSLHVDRKCAVAIEVLRTATEQWPESWRAHSLLGSVRCKDAGADAPSAAVAIEELQTAVKLNPLCHGCFLELGARFSEANMLHRALESLTSAYTLAPKDPRTLLLIGRIQAKLEQSGNALESLLQAKEIVDRETRGIRATSIGVSARVHASALLVESGRIEEASRLLLEAVDLDPTHVEAHQSLVLLFAANAQPAKAFKHQLLAEQELARRPEDPAGFQFSEPGDGLRPPQDQDMEPSTHASSHSWVDTLQAWSSDFSSWALSGRRNDQEEISNRTGRVAPRLCAGKQHSAQKVQGRANILLEKTGSVFQLASMFAAQGQVDEAVTCFEQVLESNHETLGPAAELELGMILLKHHRDEQSRAVGHLMHAAQTLAVDHPKHLEALLWAAHLAPSQGERLALLVSATHFHQGSAVAFVTLGLEYERREAWADARKAFQHAVECPGVEVSLQGAHTYFRLARARQQELTEVMLDDGHDLADGVLMCDGDIVANFARVLEVLDHKDFDLHADAMDAAVPVVPGAFDSVEVLRIAAQVEMGRCLRIDGQAQRASDALVDAAQRLAELELGIDSSSSSSSSAENRASLAAICAAELGWVFGADEQPVLSLWFSRAGFALECTHSRSQYLRAAALVGQSDVGVFLAHPAHGASVRDSNTSSVTKTAEMVQRLREAGNLERAIETAKSAMHGNNDVGNKLRRTLLDLLSENANLKEALRFAVSGTEDGIIYALEGLFDRAGPGVRASVLLRGLSNWPAEDRVPEHLLGLARSLILEHQLPELALWLGEYLSSQGAAMEEVAQVFGLGLGSEFASGLSDPEHQDTAFDAHLLFVPQVLRHRNVTAPFSRATTALHLALGKLRRRQQLDFLSAIHFWTALMGQGSSSEAHLGAGEACLKIARRAAKSAKVLPRVMQLVLRLAALHFDRVRDIADYHTASQRADLNRALCGRGQALLALGQPQLARDVLERIKVSGKGESCPCQRMGLAMSWFATRETSGHLARAVANLEAMRDELSEPTCLANGCVLFLDVADEMIAVARALQHRGDCGTAARIIDVALDGFRHTPAREAALQFAQGTLSFHNGAFDRAVRSLSRAVELRPEHVQSHNNLGAALFMNDQLEEAIDVLARVLELCKNTEPVERCRLSARINLASAHALLGDLDEAQHHLHAVLKWGHLEPKIDRTAVQRQLIQLSAARGKVGMAVLNLRDLLKTLQGELRDAKAAAQAASSPTMSQDSIALAKSKWEAIADTKRDLGRILSKAGQHDEAVKVLRSVVLMRTAQQPAEDDKPTQLSSESVWELLEMLPVPAIEKHLSVPEPLADLGNAYFHAENLEQAQRLYALCARLFPQEATSHNNLGVVAFQRGEWDLATKHFAEAVRLDPSNENAVMALEHVSADGPAPWLLTVLPSTEGNPFRHETSLHSL
ncbi:Hypothetical protein SCF082_LOCUS1123 [Durusdinium trenchii]|uniref:UDP-N-acetylglucosamine--peptide N-acetylglucosaminyltransferase SPINDLY n=1 Tax=Durusdinium trenchii TaxID=1381693 RepID=A0ABP0HDG8_9DINO